MVFKQHIAPIRGELEAIIRKIVIIITTTIIYYLW